MKSVIFGGDQNYPSTSAVGFKQINSGMAGSWLANETQAVLPVSEAITITGVYFYTDAAPGAGKSYTFTIRDDGANTAVSAVLSDSNVTASWTGSVSIAADSQICLKSTPSGTPTAGVANWWYITYETSGTSFIMGCGNYNNVSASATNYMLASGSTGTAWTTSATTFEFPMPMGATLTAISAMASGTPGSGKSYAVSVRKNDTTDVMTATISDTNTTATASGSQAFSAGDTIVVKCVPSGTPTARQIKFSMSFTPDVNGETAFGFASASSPSTTATNYDQIQADGGGWTATESSRAVSAFPPFTIKNLYWKLATAPGAGKSRALTARDDSTDEALTSTISDTNTTGSDTSNSFTGAMTATGAPVSSWKLVPSGTPAASAGVRIGYVVYISPILLPNVSDNVTATESVGVSITGGGGPTTLEVNVSDSVTVTEAVTVAIQPTTTLAANVSDTVTTSELALVNILTQIAVSDNVTLSEAVTLLITILYIVVSDTVTTSEAVSVAVQPTTTPTINVSDTVTTSEAVTVAIQPTTTYGVNVSDSTTASEAVTLLIPTLYIVVSDTVTTSEAVTVAIQPTTTPVINVSDSVTTSEAVGVSIPVVGATIITVSESVTVTESSTVFVPMLTLAVSDTVTTSEASITDILTTINVSDTTTVSESVAVTINAATTLTVSVSDTVTASEAVVSDVGTTINVSDTTTLSESVTVTIAVTGTDLINVLDTVTTSESSTVFVPTLTLAVSDTVTTSEAVSVQKVGAGTVTYPSVKGIELGGGLVKVLKSGVSQIAFVNGAPTDTPVGYLMAFDYANNKLYIYNVNTASWKSVTLS